jgi:hypothetical protein
VHFESARIENVQAKESRQTPAFRLHRPDSHSRLLSGCAIFALALSLVALVILGTSRLLRSSLARRRC